MEQRVEITVVMSVFVDIIEIEVHVLHVGINNIVVHEEAVKMPIHDIIQ